MRSINQLRPSRHPETLKTPSWTLLQGLCLAFALFSSTSLLAATTSDSSNSASNLNCASYLAPTAVDTTDALASPIPLTPTEQGFLALLRASLQDGLVSPADLGPWFDKLQRGEMHNPLAHLADTVESKIYKDGFDLLIAQIGQSEFATDRLVSVVDRLRDKSRAAVVAESDLVKSTLVAVFGPSEVLRFKVGNSEFVSPPHIIQSDSGPEVIVTATQSEIALSQLGDFGSDGIINAPKYEPTSSPAMFGLGHFVSSSGNSFIAVAYSFGTTIYSATDGDAQPLTFPIARRDWHGNYGEAKQTWSGFGGVWTASIPVVDVPLEYLGGPTRWSHPDLLVEYTDAKGRQSQQRFKLPTEAHSGGPYYASNSDQADGGVLTVGLMDGNFAFFKPKRPGTLVHFLNLEIGAPKKVHSSNILSSALNWLRDQWRVRTISLRTKERLIQMPVYFTDRGQEYLAFGLSDKNFYLVNLKDPSNPQRIDIGENLAAPPVFRRFDTRNGFLALRGESGTTYLVDIDAPGRMMEIPPATRTGETLPPRPFTALSGHRLHAFHNHGYLGASGLGKDNSTFIKELGVIQRETPLRNPFYHRTRADEEFLGLWTGKSYFLKVLDGDRVLKVDLQPYIEGRTRSLEPVFYSLKSGKAYIILTDNKSRELKFIDIETGRLQATVNMGHEIAFPPQPYISGDGDERLLVTLRESPNSHHIAILRMLSAPEQKDLK